MHWSEGIRLQRAAITNIAWTSDFGCLIQNKSLPNTENLLLFCQASMKLKLNY